jgi:hypothetical protein
METMNTPRIAQTTLELVTILINEVAVRDRYEVSVEAHPRDPSTLNISSPGSPESVKLAIFVDDDEVIIFIDNDGCPAEFILNPGQRNEDLEAFFHDVFAGQVSRLTLPLFDRIKVGDRTFADIDFHLPFGRKSYKPYKSLVR